MRGGQRVGSAVRALRSLLREQAGCPSAQAQASTSGRGVQCVQKRRMGGGPPGGFWSEGTQEKPTGLLFGETPPAPGQSRKWESWEAVWYATLAASGVLLTVGLSAKPDNGITSWAKEEAMQRRYGAAKEEQASS
mmetsp:Transcript_12217/g.31676  ORF Transcript_12217/g.31676 Transcript_12217/m.31676 type:complete len:135 (-) Transcript_12217:442-846(-)|eukprot:CAMPEP_0197489710 /NCGR_PEP_ID=MMETSP1311-20131121/4435_1 /TAXON_ID=464262 /ORGANISM="Genus nov. species nov., Strain RCC856" /LENGTH=134 /DNA_ID=CAMNT_0043034073 /DNA_START=70 /DNA_END=474 /DNA_ORIENTATION=+